MSEFIGKAPEVEREESPRRFLELFARTTGMRRAEEFLKEDATFSDSEKFLLRTGALGAVVVGSCNNPASTPRDLDVVLVIQGLSVSMVENYIRMIQFDFGLRFSIETGRLTEQKGRIEYRLDVIGVVDEDFNPYFSPSSPPCVIAPGGEPPIVFAFNKRDADSISSKVLPKSESKIAISPGRLRP